MAPRDYIDWDPPNPLDKPNRPIDGAKIRDAAEVAWKAFVAYLPECVENFFFNEQESYVPGPKIHDITVAVEAAKPALFPLFLNAHLLASMNEPEKYAADDDDQWREDS